MMHKKVYDLAAAVIGQQYRHGGIGLKSVHSLVGAFELEFSLDNPRFDHERFRAAVIRHSDGSLREGDMPCIAWKH